MYRKGSSNLTADPCIKGTVSFRQNMIHLVLYFQFLGLVRCFGCNGLWDIISVYIEPPPRERVKMKRYMKGKRKMSK